MHTAENPSETITEQAAAPQTEALEQPVPPPPAENTTGEGAGGANGTQALSQHSEQLQALQAENEALRKENQELSKRCESLQTEAAGKTDDTVNQLNELKTALTDRVYLLVCAYEETIEKIDRLLESLSPSPEKSGMGEPKNEEAPKIVDSDASAAQHTQLHAGELPVSKAADALTEEKKVSIIETLKNNSKPAEPVKPAFGVTHKERANAKNLLKKYSKIK